MTRCHKFIEGEIYLFRCIGGVEERTLAEAPHGVVYADPSGEGSMARMYTAEGEYFYEWWVGNCDDDAATPLAEGPLYDKILRDHVRRALTNTKEKHDD